MINKILYSAEAFRHVSAACFNPQALKSHESSSWVFSLGWGTCDSAFCCLWSLRPTSVYSERSKIYFSLPPMLPSFYESVQTSDLSLNQSAGAAVELWIMTQKKCWARWRLASDEWVCSVLPFSLFVWHVTFKWSRCAAVSVTFFPTSASFIDSN